MRSGLSSKSKYHRACFDYPAALHNYGKTFSDFKKSCKKALKKAEKVKKAKASGKTIAKVIPMSTIKEMEKTNIQKAIKEYERYVTSKQAKDAPYKRLCVLYRKNNDYDGEVRVLKTAIEVFSDNDKKLTWFKKRLAKLE